MPDALARHAGCVRAFYHFGQSWYARPWPTSQGERLDDINMGLYHPDGGTSGEFSIAWEWLSGQPVCRLHAFDDSWFALSRFSDFLSKLAAFDRAGPFSGGGPLPKPSQVIALLKECGIVDHTKRSRNGYSGPPPCGPDDYLHAQIALRSR